MLALVGLLAGCGGSGSATLYVLFDASDSSSTLIREGYRVGAVLMGTEFCQQHPGSGEIDFSAITASAEVNTQFESLQCPRRINNTDFQAKMLVFGSQLEATVNDISLYQEPVRGTDIIGAILYGANQTFDRFKPKSRYLVVFSDMQQFGDGVRPCVQKSGAAHAADCLSVYFKRHPEFDAKRPELQDTAVFVIGVGQTAGGSLGRSEILAYRAFWKVFFRREHAKVCSYGTPNLPVTNNSDGTQSIPSKYFSADCLPIRF